MKNWKFGIISKCPKFNSKITGIMTPLEENNNYSSSNSFIIFLGYFIGLLITLFIIKII
jgi:hypothetical protein